MSANDNGARLCSAEPINWRFFFIVHSIGVAGHFQLYSDSVVGNIYPAAKEYLLNIYHDESTVESEWENIVAMREIGIGLGCFATILLNYVATLRGQLIIGLLLDIVGLIIIGVIIFFDVNIYTVGFGRLLNGLGHGIAQTVGNVFLLEVSPQNKRGSAISYTVMWGCAGELAGLFFSLNPFMGNATGWKICMIVPLVLTIPAMWFIIRASESPRHLFKQGLEAEAQKSLHYYQGFADARASGEEIRREIAFQDNIREEDNFSDAGPAFKRFGNGQFVRPLLLACFIQAFVHLDDWLWVSFSTAIFEKNGSTASLAQLCSLVMVIPQTVVALVGCHFFDRYARKQLLLYPSGLSAVMGALASGYLLLKGSPVYTFYVLVAIAAVDLSAASVSGEGAHTIVPELFLPQDKVVGTAIAGMAQHGFGWLLTTYILTFTDTHGTIAALFPFSVVTCIYVFINYKYLPETANKTSEEIAAQFSKEIPCKRLVSTIRKTLSRPTKVQAFMLFIQLVLCLFIFRSGIKIFHIIFSRRLTNADDQYLCSTVFQSPHKGACYFFVAVDDVSILLLSIFLLLATDVCLILCKCNSLELRTHYQPQKKLPF